MLGTILRFEVRYHLTRPITYLYMLFFFALSFFFVATDAVTISGGSGQVMRNAPWVITQVMLLMAALGQIVLTGLVGTAILRDYQYRTHELLFTTPISRFDYLGGRFLGAFIVMVIVHLGIPLGMIIGTWMPWVDRAKLLPFALDAYLMPFLTLTVPTVLLLSAIFFTVGALTRNLFAIYTQGIFLLVAWSIAGRLTADVENRTIASLIDPFGIQPFVMLTRYWTVAEKNSQLVPIVGDLLLNRFVWTAVALALVAITFAAFRFRSAPPTLRRTKAKETVSTAAPALTIPTVAAEYGARAFWAQLLSSVRMSYLSIVRQVPFLAITTIGLVNLAMSAAYADSLYGQKVWPVTYTMAETVTGVFIIFFVILITIYAGEAVWRERQLQNDQIVDALPVRTSVSLFGKLFGLILVEATLLLALMVTGIIIQAMKGYHNYEVGLYLRYLYGTTFPSLVQLTVLAFAIHVLVNQKFVGHLVMILVYIARIAAGELGVEHQLFLFAAPAPFTYSDMNGFGPFVPNIVLNAIYWSAICGILVVLAYLFWVRGTEDKGRVRRRIARQRWRGGAVAATLVSAAIAISTGGAIFYNTNVLNRYRTSKDNRRIQADYERTYKKLEKVPQPRLVDADVRMDLVPERRAFTAAMTLTYVNKAGRPIDTLIVTNQHTRIHIDTLQWDRPATALVTDTVLATRIFRLVTPLLPGDTVRLRYRGRLEEEGFENGGANTVVVANGTFVGWDYTPVLGYQPSIELGSDDERKKEHLQPKARMASIDDESARQDTYIGVNADWVNFHAIVSTAPDQIAIAPGYLEKEYEENGRRVFEYRMDKPMLAFFAFLSGRYEVKRDEWNGIKLEIYYHKGHEYNLDRMMESMKASLAYFSEHFSPYQFRQVRIIEFPRYAGFAQAFPNTVPYSESIGFILRAPEKDEELDMPFYVTAHEVGHQWWAHQVIGGNMQGSTLFSEGMANYSALTAVEKRYGQGNLQKFLANELDRYLSGRASESKREMPLLLVENQPYIHYNKGSLALYALRDYIGEAAMDRAASGFLRDKAFQSPPFTTSREFVSYLDAETPDSLKYVIEDLFRTITLWDNATEEASYTARSDGKFDVTIKVKSHKFRADSLGNQTEMPMADLVDVGVFGEREPGNKIGKALYLQKQWIRSNESTITVTVDTEPRRAGVDPYNKLIDRDPKDNLKETVKR